MNFIKDYMKEVKGACLKHKVKVFIRYLEDSFYRFWKGYDSCDVFYLSASFTEKYKKILSNLLNSSYCPQLKIPKEYKGDFDDRLYYTETESEMIIRTMLHHLEMMDEDYVEKVLYGKNVYDDDYNTEEYTIEKARKIFEVMDQNKEAFMKLFNTFYWEL